MTETERWVNVACERIVQSGRVRLYRDLYKDLRERHPCGVACRLIVAGLDGTRRGVIPPAWASPPQVWGARARAIASLTRLVRWATGRQVARYAEENDVV